MRQYLKLHEAYVRELLDGKHGELSAERWAEALAFHETQTRRMQHERLIHLIVTMSVALFFLLALGFVAVHTTLAGLIVMPLLLVLTAAYLLHYFRLENGVQRWYHLANRLAERAGAPGARYDDGRVTPFGDPPPPDNR
ncbi:MAG: hypothetical protein JXB32_24210 [Deltaproteobacteria bacterium]|nr:hypothetical protein [Deltaproteobacteria bacterium]